MIPKIKTLKKWNKIPENITTLYMSIIYKNHMMYGFWDMECDGQNFFIILDFFLPFYPSNDLKNENFYKMKKLFGDIIILQNISPNMMIMCYIAPEIWCVTDAVFFFILVYFLSLYLPRDIIILHMCTKNYDDMMYCSRDMVRNRRIDRQTDGQKKWHIEVGALTKN